MFNEQLVLEKSLLYILGVVLLFYEFPLLVTVERNIVQHQLLMQQVEVWEASEIYVLILVQLLQTDSDAVEAEAFLP